MVPTFTRSLNNNNQGQEFIEFVKDIDLQIERKSMFTAGIEQLRRPYKDEAIEKSGKVIKRKKISQFFKKPCQSGEN